VPALRGATRPADPARAGTGLCEPGFPPQSHTGLVVEADALTKHYGARVAVEGVSFQVRAGEVMGLLGPNGSGKSTILRLLTGYLTPTGGSARVGGYDVVKQARSARSCVGYVPEDAPLYPGMRVDELLAFMGRLRGLRGLALNEALEDACDQLGLQSVRSRLIGTLSRGYRQRVAIAQAILHRPPLLVLDEPTNGLDPRQIIELRELIRALARDCAVLVTSHVLAEIERVAHRVAILVNGRLLKVHALQGTGADESAWLRLRLRAPCSADLRRLICDIPGVVLVELDGESDGLSQWRVLTADAFTPERIARDLSRARVGVHEITTTSSDLEQLFLRLTAAAAAHGGARA
jgi:ABC-2 type transport system ATP-binding protein